ncbi:MAG: hypothetical protein LQ348_001449 [Seirophora lacunosa]|nr:MAG: hypothetical protein LQ348_001449 [Seirophora lacunosa]
MASPNPTSSSFALLFAAGSQEACKSSQNQRDTRPGTRIPALMQTITLILSQREESPASTLNLRMMKGRNPQTRRILWRGLYEEEQESGAPVKFLKATRIVSNKPPRTAKLDPTTPVSSAESSSEAYNSAIRSLADRGKKQAGSATLACDKTVVILDSRLKAIATAPLIAGEEPWQQLLEYLEPSSQSECLALAVVGLAFEAVAARWVHYILCMHNYIASVEERVYEDPADDSRTGALWSVSKQLLQAERLLKFHILLLENIQNDFGGLSQGETSPADWLRPNLDEFKRLSSEVEETLKKPTAHMVDLVSAEYHSD